MKNRLLCIACLLLASVALPAFAAPDATLLAAVTAADDERLAATKAGDRARLAAIFSDALHYAHSSGKIDTKASYMTSLITRSTVYESFDYQTRTFTPIAPGIVQMTGRVLIKAFNQAGRADNDLNFLAIWREENGQWRFLAWQSLQKPAARRTG